MTIEKFNDIINRQIEHCRAILCNKAKEYATADRLHNFKVAGALQGISPVQALIGMMAKHTVSVADMCMSGETYPQELWDEKITDSINYLLLLSALVREGNVMRENKDNPIMLDDIPDAWRDRCSGNGHERYKDENGERRYKDNNEVEKSRKIKMKPIREITADINIDRLAEICEAEREGQLVVLPCKVGDMVWFKTQELDISKGTSKYVIDEYIITEIRGNKYNPLWYMASSERCIHRDFHPTEIGKTVFLTREEAEKALAEREENNERN